MDYNPPGSSVYGILQARILESVTRSFSRKSSQPRGWTRVSCMAGRFFTVWAIREALCSCKPPDKSQWNWHVWGWDIGRVDRDVLKSGVRRSLGLWYVRTQGAHPCMCIGLLPSSISVALPVPTFIPFQTDGYPWRMRKQIVHSPSLVLCRGHSDLLREWCARSPLLLKMGNQRVGRGQDRYQKGLHNRTESIEPFTKQKLWLINL